MYIKRERYLQKIRPYYNVDLIKVLTGVRRCGKSILLEQIEEEFVSNGFDKTHIIRINFEDLQFEKIRTAEKLNSYITKQIKEPVLSIKNAKTVQSVRINPLAIQIDPPEVISHDEDSYTDAPV